MELEQVIRQIYRVPVEKEDKVTVAIDGNNYDVVNLGSHGIGIRLPNPPSFSVDARNHEIRLGIGGKILLLTGKIVHVTPYGADSHLCGIKLVDMGKETEQLLLDCVYRLRAKLFHQG
ncbi:MAG: PilZ domain-containing protein [Desulfobacteraceae bacterium]|nr:PilZ domain-containing protein [Desulfobacteraceae bacterium]